MQKVCSVRWDYWPDQQHHCCQYVNHRLSSQLLYQIRSQIPVILILRTYALYSKALWVLFVTGTFGAASVAVGAVRLTGI